MANSNSKALAPVVLNEQGVKTWHDLFALGEEVGVDPVTTRFIVPSQSPSGLSIPTAAEIQVLDSLNAARMETTATGQISVQLIGEEGPVEGGVVGPNVERSTTAAAKPTRFAKL